MTEVIRLVPAMQARAIDLDAEEAFPEQDMALLRELGALLAPLPARLGGRGAGTEAAGAALIASLLRTLGQGNLAIGRLFEAHVNALQLITPFGSAAQIERVAADVQDGHLFGLWVTDPPGQALTLEAGILRGSKGPCSGAGHVTRALVTTTTVAGAQMAVVAVDGSLAIVPMRRVLQGMRAAVNGVVQFDGTPLRADALIGRPGDYLIEPHLSCGAWRTTAVTLGGLDALVAATGRQLVRKGHQDAPLQQDRFGRMLIAQETARLWTIEAANRVESSEGSAADRVAYVNLARIAVEAACLDAMRLAQRALGLAAFVRPNPVERLLRDLAVYLRQPAPDAVLTEAAHHALQA
ncbi:MAG: acyl-CoA dehydrogenase family protein [Acetobacteraceae bacterium]